jgi:hypothetical protein
MQLTHSLKAPGFKQPLSLSSDVLVSKFGFTFNLYRYVAATYEVIKATGAVNLTLGAAGAAGVASLLTAPCDAIKQRMQVKSSRTLRGELAKVMRSPKPLAAFFVGYPQLLMRDLPFDAIQMTSFEMLRRWHSKAVDPGWGGCTSLIQLNPELAPVQLTHST